MTGTSMIFFIVGATVLWGGLVVSLLNLLKHERKESKVISE